MTTVYLAGGISHNTYDEATNWRKLAAERLAVHYIDTLDPMRGKVQEQWDDGGANFDYPGFSTNDIFTRDLADIRESDILLVNLTTAKSVGTPFEMGYAYARTIPLFVVAEPSLQRHPFVCECADYLTENIYDAIDEIVRFNLYTRSR